MYVNTFLLAESTNHNTFFHQPMISLQKKQKQTENQEIKHAGGGLKN